MPSHIKVRQMGLPEAMRKALVESRRKRGWSQGSDHVEQRVEAREDAMCI